MATWLITGAGGWLGGRVLDALVGAPGSADRIVVLGRKRPESLRGALFVSADLRDAEGLGRVVGDLKPDVVIHAAGKTPPAPDEELYETNFWGTGRLLGALRAQDRPIRVVVAGSAAEFGPVPDAELPIADDCPCRPVTAYGRSKAMATAAALSARGPMEVVVGRVFNLVGPGMPPSLAFGRFAAELASPAPEPITLRTGRLDARRDFVDVRDAAKALIALAIDGEPGRAYNIASGRSRPIREGLDLLVGFSGRSVRIESDDRARRGEPDDSRALVDRIAADVGWRPTFSFGRSMQELWADAAARGGMALPLTA